MSSHDPHIAVLAHAHTLVRTIQRHSNCLSISSRHWRSDKISAAQSGHVLRISHFIPQTSYRDIAYTENLYTNIHLFCEDTIPPGLNKRDS